LDIAKKTIIYFSWLTSTLSLLPRVSLLHLSGDQRRRDDRARHRAPRPGGERGRAAHQGGRGVGLYKLNAVAWKAPGVNPCTYYQVNKRFQSLLSNSTCTATAGRTNDSAGDGRGLSLAYKTVRVFTPHPSCSKASLLPLKATTRPRDLLHVSLKSHANTREHGLSRPYATAPPPPPCWRAR
jgi:hypothetical protein